jgi:hypothetical protein
LPLCVSSEREQKTVAGYEGCMVVSA